jgi:hypothetical protein
MQQSIGTLQESSLHASLKQWYSKTGDLVETDVDGSVVDLVRGNLCIEIQTRNFSAIKKKITALLSKHPVRVVYPVPLERFIIRIDINTDKVISRRKSPKRGSFLDIFSELVRITQLVKYENFSIEVLMIKEEQIWLNDGKGSWRRKGWSISDRRLIEVLGSKLFLSPDDYKKLLPSGLSETFTVTDLVKAIQHPRRNISKMAYCLREIGVIELVGKKGRAYIYRVKE